LTALTWVTVARVTFAASTVFGNWLGILYLLVADAWIAIATVAWVTSAWIALAATALRASGSDFTPRVAFVVVFVNLILHFVLI